MHPQQRKRIKKLGDPAAYRAERQLAGNPQPEYFCPSTRKELLAIGQKDSTDSKLI